MMRIVPLLLAAALAGCAVQPAKVDPSPVLTMEQLLKKQIYQMSPQEVHRYIAHMQQAEPDLRRRIAAIGRQNIGQPYVLNLLGEYPYQLHDNLPMFSLTHSDCVVFAEHTYAMALSKSWEEFFWMLQRIRYKDGVVGVATRNHYTEQDWNINNGWLVTDISAQLGGANTASYELTVDRERFLRTRHNTERKIPVQVSTEAYIPTERVNEVLAQLQDGDFVNVISTKNGGYWASHVGLVVTTADGKRNFLNSADPQVREESFDAFVKRVRERDARNGANGQKLAGFKFLRLNDNIVVPPALPQPRPE
ncbi:MAG TPA: N-acetylmuramoyl-L-alanine amidase-like domain-containing protein [Telluria sp.]|nr:N-acetylmuramoyl-L-alanine amidase-like domain-containing protein [Telluria sp.]